MFLGVRPGLQGKGYGSRLLRQVTDKWVVGCGVGSAAGITKQHARYCTTTDKCTWRLASACVLACLAAGCWLRKCCPAVANGALVAVASWGVRYGVGSSTDVSLVAPPLASLQG